MDFFLGKTLAALRDGSTGLRLDFTQISFENIIPRTKFVTIDPVKRPAIFKKIFDWKIWPKKSVLHKKYFLAEKISFG